MKLFPVDANSIESILVCVVSSFSLPPANTARVDDAIAMAVSIGVDASPKSIPFPNVAIVTKSILFVTVGVI